jgi:hypothetical protein
MAVQISQLDLVADLSQIGGSARVLMEHLGYSV